MPLHLPGSTRVQSSYSCSFVFLIHVQSGRSAGSVLVQDENLPVAQFKANFTVLMWPSSSVNSTTDSYWKPFFSFQEELPPWLLALAHSHPLSVSLYLCLCFSLLPSFSDFFLWRLIVFIAIIFIETQLIYNVLASGVEQSDSIIHTYIHTHTHTHILFFTFSSIIGYHKVLSAVP